MDSTAIPHRIALVKSSLVATLRPGTAGIVIKSLDWPSAEEQKLFPQFSVDRHFVAVLDGSIRYSISGVLEWGVFWYRLDEGEPKAPTTEALFWCTIDRLDTIVANVTDRLMAARKPA
jgi:hypothetical protein